MKGKGGGMGNNNLSIKVKAILDPATSTLENDVLAIQDKLNKAGLKIKANVEIDASQIGKQVHEINKSAGSINGIVIPVGADIASLKKDHAVIESLTSEHTKKMSAIHEANRPASSGVDTAALKKDYAVSENLTSEHVERVNTLLEKGLAKREGLELKSTKRTTSFQTDEYGRQLKGRITQVKTYNDALGQTINIKSLLDKAQSRIQGKEVFNKLSQTVDSSKIITRNTKEINQKISAAQTLHTEMIAIQKKMQGMDESNVRFPTLVKDLSEVSGQYSKLIGEIEEQVGSIEIPLDYESVSQKWAKFNAANEKGLRSLKDKTNASLQNTINQADKLIVSIDVFKDKNIELLSQTQINELVKYKEELNEGIAFGVVSDDSVETTRKKIEGVKQAVSEATARTKSGLSKSVWTKIRQQNTTTRSV